MKRDVLEPPVVFVSDVHLKQGDAEYLARFLEFLRGPCRGARHLVIHGDLFEFYVGPRQGRDPWWTPLHDALRVLASHGTVITVLHGNRDFQIEPGFGGGVLQVRPGDWKCMAGDKRLRVSHGDELCVDDWSYQIFGRWLLRLAPLRWLLRTLPFGLSRLLAVSYRRVSKARWRGQVPGRLDSMLKGARRWLGEEDVLVAGHIHELAVTDLDGRGTTVLYTTGAWEDGPNHILWSGREFRLVKAGVGA